MKLSEHKNTIEKRHRKRMRDDFLRDAKLIFDTQDIRAVAFVAIDANGEAYCEWDTGGVVPMWAFPGMAQRALDYDLAQVGAEEDFEMPFMAENFKRMKKP